MGNEQISDAGKLKTVQNFLRGNAEISYRSQNKKFIKKEEEKHLLNFASVQNLFYSGEISEEYFIAEGAEQKVYRFNDFQVIKTNGAIFYETWLDYFNNLLIHNYFFPATAYEFVGFAMIDNKLFAVVRQNFIVATEPTNLNIDTVFYLTEKFLNYDT